LKREILISKKKLTFLLKNKKIKKNGEEIKFEAELYTLYLFLVYGNSDKQKNC
jgi:hypothetical protein